MPVTVGRAYCILYEIHGEFSVCVCVCVWVGVWVGACMRVCNTWNKFVAHHIHGYSYRHETAMLMTMQWVMAYHSPSYINYTGRYSLKTNYNCVYCSVHTLSIPLPRERVQQCLQWVYDNSWSEGCGEWKEMTTSCGVWWTTSFFTLQYLQHCKGLISSLVPSSGPSRGM